MKSYEQLAYNLSLCGVVDDNQYELIKLGDELVTTLEDVLEYFTWDTHLSSFPAAQNALNLLEKVKSLLDK